MRHLLALLAALTLLFSGSHSDGRERCGPNDCAEGEGCCNYGCGICTPPDGACIELFCNWGRPTWIDSPHIAGADVFDALRLGLSFVNQRFETTGAPETSVGGLALQARGQYYVAEQTAVRLALAGTQLFDDQAAPDDATTGYTVGGGLSYRLPDLGHFIGWALIADAEYRGGPELTTGLGPAVLTDGGVVSVAAGMGFANLDQAGPITMQLRYVHSFFPGDDGPVRAGLGDDIDELGVIDLAIGVSTDLRWIHLVGGPEIPIGLRLGYRFSADLSVADYTAHELGGGVYGFSGDELSVGLDAVAQLADLPLGVDTVRLGVTALVRYYWDANF